MITNAQNSPKTDWSLEFAGLSGAALRLAQKIPATDGIPFADTWAKTFEVLIALQGELPVVSTPENVLGLWPDRPRGSWFETATSLKRDYEDIDFEPTEGVIYAVLSTRQGGGNREYGDYNNDELAAHPNYLDDWDESGDSTYATYVYSTELTENDLNVIGELKLLNNTLASQLSLIQSIEDLTVAPWSILSEERLFDVELQVAKRELRAKGSAINSERLEASREFIAYAEGIMEGSNAENFYDDEKLRSSLGFGYNYAAHSIPRKLNDLRVAHREMARLKAMNLEASMLQDGALKEYLLGDRGTGSYNVTEKRGRRNVVVAKTFERGTLLGSELASAENSFNTAKNLVEAILTSVRETVGKLEAAEKDVSMLLEKVTELEVKAWSEGWPTASGQTVPARP